jgi:3-isopropylmalate/(R)-2-methylmalate dehydratase small subunit
MSCFEAMCVRRVGGVVSTDDILPARYKHMYTNPDQMAQHVFEHFAGKPLLGIAGGDALVGDDVFGVGSSREQAVSALVAAGVKVVLAPSFGEIFYRNCWNLALPALALDTEGINEGDTLNIDLQAGTVVGNQNGRTWRFKSIPVQLMNMIAYGGLLPMVAKTGGFDG